MSVTGVSGAFSSPFRGNYSGCVAWRQQGPQAQLVSNTTQVAVNPFAPTPTFPPASPHQWRDRNQTNHNLLKGYTSGMENKVSSHVFTPSLLLLQEWGEERRPWAVLSPGCLIGFKTWGTQDKWPLTCLSSFPVVICFFVGGFLRHQKGGDWWAYNACSQTCTGHLTTVKL